MADYTQFSILISIGFEGLKKLNLPHASLSKQWSISNFSWKSQYLVNQAGNGKEENRQLRDIVI